MRCEGPTIPTPQLHREPAWVRRFRARRVSLPQWAEDAPHRCIYRANFTGVFELYAWDRDTDTHRQVTERPNGTRYGRISRDGNSLWWFNDTDGDEWGTWQREPFAGGAPAEAAAPDLLPSYSAGLALGNRSVVIGRTTDDGTSVHLVRTDGSSTVVYESDQDAGVGDLSRDETLWCLSHSEHGDSRHPALRVISVNDNTVIADLWDGPGKMLACLGFSPVHNDQRLLVSHERRGRTELLIWDPTTGLTTEVDLGLPGEVIADWYPNGKSLLVVHYQGARSDLYRYDIESRTLSRLDSPIGTISAATVRPDETVEFLSSSASSPPLVRSSTGKVVLKPRGDSAPPAAQVEDLWVDGPGGKIHALMARPSTEYLPPYAAVFLVHGGPTAQDRDEFMPVQAAYVDAGYCVIQVNYRGSVGYGSAWRDAIEGRPGLVELEDISAVREWAVSRGLIDPARCILSGASWGGFLTLLGLGAQPSLWAAGVAAVPVADYVAAYEDEMEELRAFDRSLFGGSPTDVRDRYERSSPITYVEHLRAPVFILAGANDARCPLRQIENYLSRLEALAKPYEFYRFDAGHGSLVVEEQIRQVEAMLDFCRSSVAP